jgi:hypothetical protein
MAANDPAKQTEAVHKTVTTVAKALSDTYFKVDDALLNLPIGSELGAQLKAIRDNIFVQKQKAEQLVSSASEAVAALPPPPPEEPAAPEAPAAAPTAASKAARIPRVQSEAVYNLTIQGRPGKSGNLSTDGKVISLHGNPIFYVENGHAFASWAGWPTMTTAANVNALADVAGIQGQRPFFFQAKQPMVQGKPVQGSTTGWHDLGPIAGFEPAAPAPEAAPVPAVASKRAGVPTLLLPRRK